MFAPKYYFLLTLSYIAVTWHIIRCSHRTAAKEGVGLFRICYPRWYTHNYSGYIQWQQEGTPYWEDVPADIFGDCVQCDTPQEVAALIADYKAVPKKVGECPPTNT